jgi:hypothetical protein
MVVSVSLSISEFRESEDAESMSRENSAAPFADRMPFLILSEIRKINSAAEGDWSLRWYYGRGLGAVYHTHRNDAIELASGDEAFTLFSFNIVSRTVARDLPEI